MWNLWLHFVNKDKIDNFLKQKIEEKYTFKETIDALNEVFSDTNKDLIDENVDEENLIFE